MSPQSVDDATSGWVTDEEFEASQAAQDAIIADLQVTSEAPLRTDQPEFADEPCPLEAMMNVLNTAPPGASRYEGIVVGREEVPAGTTLPALTQNDVALNGGGHGVAHIRIANDNTDQGYGLRLQGNRQTVTGIRLQNNNTTTGATGWALELDGCTDATIEEIMISGFSGLAKIGETTQSTRYTISNVTGSWNAAHAQPVIRIYKSINHQFDRIVLNGGALLPGTGLWTVPAAYIHIEPPANQVVDAGFFNDVVFQCQNQDATDAGALTGYWWGLLVKLTGTSTMVNQKFSAVTCDHQVGAGALIINNGRYMRFDGMTDCRLTNDFATGSNGSGIVLVNNGTEATQAFKFNKGNVIVSGERALYASRSDHLYQLLVRGTSGSYKLTHSGNETAAISPSDNAQTVQTRLANLASIGDDDVRVLGGPGATGGHEVPYLIFFTGALANANPSLTVTSNTVAGGTTPGATLSTLATGAATPAGETDEDIDFSMNFHCLRDNAATNRAAMVSIATEGVTLTGSSTRGGDRTSQSDRFAEVLKDISTYDIAPTTLLPDPDVGFVKHYGYANLSNTRQVRSYTGRPQDLPRLVFQSSGRATAAGLTGHNYFLFPGAQDQDDNTIAVTSSGIPVFYLDPADHRASGLNTKLLIDAQVSCPNTLPSCTVTFGLYPISVNASNLDLGTVTASSTVAVAAVQQSFARGLLSPALDITSLTAGHFIVGYTLSAVPGTNLGLAAKVYVFNKI